MIAPVLGSMLRKVAGAWYGERVTEPWREAQAASGRAAPHRGGDGLRAFAAAARRYQAEKNGEAPRENIVD